MSSVCGMDEKIGLERLEFVVSNREVDVDTANWAVDGTRTYSLRYTSIALSNALHWEGRRTSKNGSSEVVFASQATIFHEMDSVRVPRSS